MNTLTTSLALCAVLAISGTAQAALYDRGGGLIYDSDLNITWLQDANYAKTSGYDVDGKMGWDESVSWAANLSYYDNVRKVTYDDWRLPITRPVNGISLSYSATYNGSTDSGWNVSAPGTLYAGSTASEMAHLFYNSLNNKGYCDPITSSANNSNCVVQTVYGLVNTGPFTNFQHYLYWSGTDYWIAGAAWTFTFGSVRDDEIGAQMTNSKGGNYYYALAARDGDVAAVPVPAAAWLLGSGLLGLAGFARRGKAT